MLSNRLSRLATFGRTTLALGLLVVGLGHSAFAGSVARAPEIDAGSMTAGLALLSGAVLVVTNRFRRK